MSNLLSFLFNTIRTRAIDPGNAKFFLPTVLSGLSGSNSTGKLLPIEQDHWSLGAIKGTEGATITRSMIDNWATFLEKVQKVDLSSQYPIADPANPDPTFSLGDGQTKVVVDGLQNVFVLPNPNIQPIAEGYRARIALQFNHWNGQGGLPNITTLSIAGPYELKQALCVANKGSNTCNGVASTEIDGDGMVALAIDDVFVDAVVKLSISTTPTHGRSVLVTIESLNARGSDASTPPTITIEQLTIGANVSEFLIGIWKTAATNAIESPDGRAGLIANLNAALNQPSNLAAISAKMTENLNSAIDGFIGPAPANLPTTGSAGLNPIDRFLFDRARNGLNDPTSKMFLPTVLASSNNPSLNPLTVSRIDLPDFTALVLFQHNFLTNLVVKGLMNIKTPISDLVFGNDTFQFAGDLGGWNPPPHVPSGLKIPPPPANATAQFSLTPTGGAQPLTGGAHLTVTSARLSGASHLSGASDSDLTINLTRLVVIVGNLVADIQFEIVADSQFKNLIDQAVNTQNMLGQIVGDVNSQLTSNLSQISAEVTKYVRQAISGALK